LNNTQSSAEKAPATTGAVAGIVVLAVALAFLFLAWGRRKNENTQRSSGQSSGTRSGGGASNKSRRRTKSDFDRRRDKRSSSNRSDRSDDTDQTEESAEVEDVAGALPSYLSGVRVGQGGTGRDVELAMARGVGGASEKQVSWRDQQEEAVSWRDQQEEARPSLFNDLTFDSLNSWMAPRSGGGGG
jgi:hypothetical protein